MTISNRINTEIITESDGRKIFKVILPLDPATISTAQQKKFDPRSGHFFANKKVARGMKIISQLATPLASTVRTIIDPAGPIELRMAFLYAYPKGTAKKDLIDLRPMPTGADCDNRAKAPIDALGKSGWWTDDRVVTMAMLSKARTINDPCIVILVANAQKKDLETYFFLHG